MQDIKLTLPSTANILEMLGELLSLLSNYNADWSEIHITHETQKIQIEIKYKHASGKIYTGDR